MTQLRRRVAALAFVAPLLLAGCGEDDPDPAPAPSPDDAATATVDEGACALLDAAAVTAALGEDMVESISGPTSCLFGPSDPASAASVTASVTEIEIDPQVYAEGTREICDSEITEVEAGDNAFACITFVGPQGFVFDGSTSVVLDVTVGDESDPAAVTAAAALLPSVAVP
ncbi:MAG: hypothetical protein Q8O61_15250 [Nocardioides sp.]|nr:hypothetical protein [Nocardioides sp.]